MKITKDITITNQMIEDLLVTALEGGSNYWYLLKEDSVKVVKDATPLMNGQPLVLRLNYALQTKGIAMPVYDIEDEDELLGHIDKASIQEAFNMMANKIEHSGHFDDLINDNMDATTGDVFFQLAVMSEVRFC